MKIVIISDTHDNLANLKKFFNFCKREKINFLIHCGDVCQGNTLSEIEKNFERICLSLGNADLKDSLFKRNKKTKIFENLGEIGIEKLKIGFCHQFNFEKMKGKIENFDFFFFGHTHWPFFKKEKKCILSNPGNLAGLFYKASFLILDTETKILELKILEKIK